MSKSQIMMTDLILAVSIFIMLATVAFMSFESQESKLQTTGINYNLQIKATVLSDLLVKQPAVFTVNSTSYGLVSEPNMITTDKINNLSNLSYNTLKDKLALGSMDFVLRLYNSNGTLVKVIGTEPSGDYSSYSAYRIVSSKEGLNYQPVTINGTLYDICAANLSGFYGRYFNLPSNGTHPDMGPATGVNITGVITGLVNNTLPIVACGPNDTCVINGTTYIHRFDWFNDSATYNGTSYFRWDKLDSNISFSNVSFWPVNESWSKDPHYYAITWTAYLYANTSKNYTYSQSSDDDSWTFIDNTLVIDLGGIHASTIKNGSIYLTAGEHKINLYFADRYQTDAGFNFTISTSGISIKPFPMINCGYNYTTAIMEMVIWQKA